MSDTLPDVSVLTFQTTYQKCVVEINGLMFRKVIASFCENKTGHLYSFFGLLTVGTSYTSQFTYTACLAYLFSMAVTVKSD